MMIGYIAELREAMAHVERQLSLEDQGWVRAAAAGDMPANERIQTVKVSRIYAMKDPLCKQAIRLWTDYTFGSGMTWNSEDEATYGILSRYWGSKDNRRTLSAHGQRQSSDKLLIDGEVFFAVFASPDGRSTVRRIDPLEITEIISDPDDAESVQYYKREWFTPQGQPRTGYYRSPGNLNNSPCSDVQGRTITADLDGVVFHLAYNSTGERGNPLLLPVLEWVRLYRQFMASRVAIMLSMARFAWKVKSTGGSSEVSSVQAALDGQSAPAGSFWAENAGAELTPIKIDTGSSQAYNDGRMLKLQVCSGVGWPEQYFADISIGNLATAKTVELPVAKMCQSYQRVWADFYDEIDGYVLDVAGVPEDSRVIDRDFPSIAPEDQASMAASIQQIVQTLPELGHSRDVLQQALMSIGVINTNEVLNALEKDSSRREKEKAEMTPGMPPAEGGDGDPSLALAKMLKAFRSQMQPEAVEP